MANGCDIKMYNVVMHGVCFMLIFTAFQTSGNVQTSVLNSIKDKDGHSPFQNKGYISLSIIYTVFSLANFVAPPIVNLFGPRVAMFFGGLCYALYIGAIIQPFVSTLYIASVVVGVGAALIWTGQGNFLTINSTDDTIGRNSGIFWALLQCSLLFGNMFVYFYFKNDSSHISNHERVVLYTVLLVCAGIGTLAIILLQKSQMPEQSLVNNAHSIPENDEDEREVSLRSVNGRSQSGNAGSRQTPLESFLRSFQLLKTSNMLCLAFTIAYTGFELTFFSGVYGTSVGNIDNSDLSDPKRQIGLVGMMIGTGEITGGLLFGIFGKRTIKYGRDPVVLLGFLVHMLTFYLIFLNLPDRAPIAKLNPSEGESWLEYNIYIYALCGFLLGFGDSSFNTQIYSILGTLYSDDSAPAFALYKCIQSVAAAIAFAYGTKLVLRYQLLILVISGILGTLSFFMVERKNAAIKDAGYEPIR
ncbi:UNC93-like protein MFSD11 [Hydractinia symbiolongicarpus]|uniref:UNC93-like protein MFSD11 n=1 Tax=Hydractinia symbiolongicarpus TaxID=13093 RepID=UPI0025505D2E|nr:UNC93-like protein MFSD11 [Hydractinia symbiolongicarpus]